MASNPPIIAFKSNGSLDLQTRINRFLTTLEPHARFFLAQGRTHLDSLVERDKTQNRTLKPDKTGWAGSTGFEGTTSLVDGRNDAHAEARGSHISVSAMSSVSQRAGRVARMRDRNGNTAEALNAVAAQRQTSGIKSKPKLKLPLVGGPDTSSSPIQPWKDIRPKTPPAERQEPESRMEPVVEIPVVEPHCQDENDEVDEQPGTGEVQTGKSKKRKLVIGGTSGRHDQNDVKKSRKQENKIAGPELAMVIGREGTRGQEDQDAKPKKGIADKLKLSKEYENGKKEPKLALATGLSKTNPRPLVDSASKINSSAKPKETMNGKTLLKQLGKTVAQNPSKRQNAPQLAEDKAREEILTVRRNKRREKLALKTTSVPVSKKKGTKTRAPESSDEDSEEKENRSEGNPKHNTGKKGEEVAAKLVKDHKEPSMALLKAYEVSGHLDRRRRITLPTLKIRLGLFGKGMSSGQTSKTSKGIDHPPDLQFQNDTFMKKRKRLPIPSSSSTEGEDVELPVDSQSSEVSMAKIRKPKVTTRDARKTANDSKGPEAQTSRARSEKSVSPDDGAGAEEQSKNPSRPGNRQASPHWPTILPEDDQPDEPESVEVHKTHAFQKNVVRGQPGVNLSHMKKSVAIMPLSTEENNMFPHEMRVDAKAATTIPGPNGDEEELRNKELHSNQQYRNDSCSPSLDAESYADMLAQALAGSSAESSCLVIDPEVNESGKIDEGAMLTFKDDRDPAEQDMYSDHHQQGSQPFRHFVEVFDDDSQQGRDTDVDYISNCKAGRQAHERYDVKEAGNGEVPFDARPPLTDRKSPAMDQDDQYPTTNTHVAFEREVTQLSETLAPDISSFESAAQDMEVDGEYQVTDSAKKNNTLDIFGTDAEQARKVLYGTRVHR